MDETYDTELIGGPGDGKRLVLRPQQVKNNPLGHPRTLRLVAFDDTDLKNRDPKAPLVYVTHVYHIEPNSKGSGPAWVGIYQGQENIGVN